MLFKSVSPGLIFLLLFFLSFDLQLLLKNFFHLSDHTYLQYYGAQAWGFVQGRLDLPGIPLDAFELSPFQGKTYSQYPPLTALLMTPLVWLTHSPHVPQRLFAMFFAALNTGLYFSLFYQLTAKQLPPIKRFAPSIAFSLLFSFGTSNVLFGVVGNHWFVGQLTASTFLLITLVILMREPSQANAFGAGLALGLALLGRVNLVATLPATLYWIFRRPESGPEKKSPYPLAILFLLPIVALGLAFLAWNEARFGTPFETGLRYQNMLPEAREKFERWGSLHPHFILTNIYYLVLRLPGFHLLDHQPWTMGFSIFAQSPFLLWLFVNNRERNPVHFTFGLWAIAGGACLIFLFLSPGYHQFGARYFFDLLPFVALLVSTRHPPSYGHLFLITAILSVIINIAGIAIYLPSHR